MLIDFNYLYQKYKLNITGILHIGAHYCEELNDYKKIGLTDQQIVWIEGNKNIVEEINKTFPQRRIYNEIVSDEDNQEVNFIITNNGQSSSILELKEHLKEHPWVFEINREKRKTITIDSFVSKNSIESNLNFVNIDIQGAELKALQGMKSYLNNVDYLYLEVNIKELYQGCGLLDDIDNFLKEFKFDRKEINMTKHGWGDAFYIKSK
jgi:FkbM family methyltransferase